jgi:hypothetical protein
MLAPNFNSFVISVDLSLINSELMGDRELYTHTQCPETKLKGITIAPAGGAGVLAVAGFAPPTYNALPGPDQNGFSFWTQTARATILSVATIGPADCTTRT